MQNEMNLGKEIHDCAIHCGFDNCGIISIDEMDEFEELYPDEFLIEQVIPKTAGHLQASDVNALRKNVARAVSYQQTK